MEPAGGSRNIHCHDCQLKETDALPNFVLSIFCKYYLHFEQISGGNPPNDCRGALCILSFLRDLNSQHHDILDVMLLSAIWPGESNEDERVMGLLHDGKREEKKQERKRMMRKPEKTSLPIHSLVLLSSEFYHNNWADLIACYTTGNNKSHLLDSSIPKTRAGRGWKLMEHSEDGT